MELFTLVNIFHSVGNVVINLYKVDVVQGESDFFIFLIHLFNYLLNYLQVEMNNKFDQYGDSYTSPMSISEIEPVLSRMKNTPILTPPEVASIEKDLSLGKLPVQKLRYKNERKKNHNFFW